MAYDRSQWTKPLNDDERKRLIEGFQPLTDAERKELLADVEKRDIRHPLTLRAIAVQAIPYHAKREALRAASRDAVGKTDDLGFQRYYPQLPDALLFDLIGRLDPGQVKGYDPAKAGPVIQRQFEAAREDLYKDRLATLLLDHGLQIEVPNMDDLHKHVVVGKVSLDSPNLATTAFDFLENPKAAPKPKPSSPYTTPLPLPAALKVLEDFRLLGGKVPPHIKALVRNKRISDPQELRAIAVEAAIPLPTRRELLRTIRATISSDGGSTHLRGFPHLPETIVYEYVNEKKKDLVDLCGKEGGCELRAYADDFFRRNRDDLYKERIREALSARGFALDDQRLEQTYLYMLRQRIPLPARRLSGAIR